MKVLWGSGLCSPGETRRFDLPDRAARRPETIRARYMATLLTQFLQLVASAITAGIVPRALGPAAYGAFNFLLNTAATLRGFLEPSTQQSFFTFSSQDHRSGSLTKIYGVSLLVQLIVVGAIILLSASVGAIGWLWPGQRLDQIVLVTALDWVSFMAIALRQLGDSKGISVRPQAITAAVSLASVAVLFFLYLKGWLNIYSYVWTNLVMAALSCAALGYWLLVRHYDLCWAGGLQGRVRAYIHRWWRYAAPLIAVEYYTPLVAYANVYLVQVWYGSPEQGYFGLALRWSALVLIFTSSSLNIVWREIAHATAAGEAARAAELYLRFNHLLFFLALALGLWLSFASPVLVPALAGNRFRGAVPVLAIMAFYPLAQTVGQLNTAVLKALGRTEAYRNVSMLLSLPDLLATYFLLAPSTAVVPGLGLGAIGVAVRMAAFLLLAVHVYEWQSCRLLSLNYCQIWRNKLVATGLVAGCAVLALRAVGGWLGSGWGQGNLFVLVLVSLVYAALIGMLLVARPELAGLSRGELRRAWVRLSQGPTAERDS